MARLIAIDYGEKRSGIAVTDPLCIIANGLTTVKTSELLKFLEQYFTNEKVDKLIIGYPKTLQNKPAAIISKIDEFTNVISQKYPHIEIIRHDERFTSKLAFQTMIDSGISKKARQNKALIDQISATIILRDYLESTQYEKR
ncbi:MAG: Holliday junction resolvase RuvX [Paludibacteraceae bacterium]|mgnify:CR=1 FL=1|nr:Holliday junction resolvase RuvX [Paludibacteraceae bacterium]